MAFKLKNHLLESYQDDIVEPRREDSEYKKIENFGLHELTYKIFYEMAIRNGNVKKIMHALNYLQDIQSIQKNEIKIEKIDCSIKNEERVYKLIGTVNLNHTDNYKIFIGINNYTFQCVESIHDNKFEVVILVNKETVNLDLHIAIGLEKYQDNKINFGLPIAYSSLMIRSTTTGVSEKNKESIISVKIDNEKFTISPNKDGSWLLDLSSSQKALTTEVLLQKYNNFLKPEEHQIYFSMGIYFINELIEELETQLIEEYLIYPNNYDVGHPEKSDILVQRASKNALDIQKLQSDSTYAHKDKYFFKQDDYDGYSIHQGISVGSDSRYNLSTIKQDSTKQVVDYNISNFQINLNLPKKELLAYLSKLKDNYDNDNSILFSPMELLGQDMGIDSEDIKNMDSNKWANVFYNYDVFQYLTYIQNKLQKDKENSIDKLKRELALYNKAGRKSGYETRKIEKIKNEYNIPKYEKEINQIGRTLQAKYVNVSKETTARSTIDVYIKFLNKNIQETKYRKYLQKTVK